MEELDEAPSTSSKMDQHEGTPDLLEETDEGIVNIKLPEQLQKITPSEEFVSVRHRWNTNEEIASILIAFHRHKEWLVLPQKIRPASGSMLLYNRKVVFYRRDGYCWKKRRNGSTIREDHMKLKVQGLECIYGSYVHSAILPTFHRRCYWLLQNPNIVLIHYLNVPYPESAKPTIPCLSYELRQKDWSKEELVDQLRPMLSRASQGTDHDAEEDQKVEKMLEEILPLLMPMQESSKAVAVGSRPLAPAPSKATPSASFLPPTTTTTATSPAALRRAVRNQSQLQMGRSGQVEDVVSQIQGVPAQTQTPMRVTALQSPMLSSQMISSHSQQPLPQPQQQQTQVQIPALHSLGHPLIQSSQITIVPTTTTQAQNFSSSNLSQDVSQAVNQNGQPIHQNTTHTGMTHYQAATHSNMARLVAVGNGGVMTSATVGKNHIIDNGSATFSVQESQNLPNFSQAYRDSGTSAPVVTSPPLTLPSSYLASTLTTAAGQGKSGSSTSTMTINQYLQNQESHQQSSGPQHNVLHQQQLQHPYQPIAQPNHSFVQASLDTQQQQHIKLQAHHLQQAQQQQQQQPAPPVLTLHLKPTNSSSSDSPGFVLSLQGATIVSQHNDQPSGLTGFNTGNSAQSVNLSNSQGVVLVASQSPTGSLLLNRISPNPQPQSSTPNNTFVTPHNSAPGAPSSFILSPFTQPSPQQNLNPSHFTSGTITMTTSAFTQADSTASAAQQFVFSSPTTTLGEGALHQPPHPHHQHDQHQHQQFSSVFPNPTTTVDAFPIKHDNDLFTFHGSDITFTKKEEPVDDSPSPLSFSMSQPSHSDGSLSLFSTSVITTKETHPVFAGTLSKPGEEPRSSFSVQSTSAHPQCVQQHQLPHQPQAHLQQHQQAHQLDTSDLMAGPSGLSASMKDMITNPNSCDTLDGSFSSLPSADLNLEDLLDLNDLDDVSDLGCSPLTPSDLSDQPITSADMVVGGKGVDGGTGGVNMMAQDHSGSCMNENMSAFGCVSNSMMYQQQNPQQPPLQQHHHQHHQTPQPALIQVPPSSPLHPGAPPRSVPSFAPMLLSSSPQGGPLSSCDNANQSQGIVGGGSSDPELNSVIKDFSPDWAYTKTNTKILVAGPWFSENSNYSCVFDGEHIPATLVQPGLLRCFTQYHSPGYATLQVARDSVIISNCEVFEFCDRESRDSNTTHPEWFAIDANQLKLLLVERLDQLRRRFVRAQQPFQDSISDDMETLEANLVQQVQAMSSQAWTDSNLYPKAGQHNLTLLHLAAGLGFAKLISCLIRWRMDNSCVALEFEVDAQSVDSHACTPLMWACALGKIDAALTLYHWNASPLKMCNKDGLLPLTLARQKGHYNLANQVEQLERAKEQQQLKQQQLQSQQKDLTATQNMDLTCSPSTSNDVLTHTSLSEGTSNEHGKDDSEIKDELIEIRLNPPPSFPKPGKPGPKLIRRFSEQVIGHQSKPLNKRNSVDLLPSGQDIDQVTLPTIGSPMGQPVREANSEPHLPVSPDMAFVAPPAPRLLLEDEIDEPSAYSGEPSTSKMDTDEVVSLRSGSPIIDVERISSDEEVDANKEGSKHQMVTLANQIIAAIPERIKLSPAKTDEADEASSGRGRTESHSSLPSQGGSPRPSSFGDDSGISTPMTDSLAFEEYRYPEFGTPSSSLSPDSTCLPSPYSPYSFTLDSPPPTTAEFTEYFNAPTTYMEKDFSQLTLSDQEQRKLYEAAKVIQNAYRHYRDKQQQQQQLQQQKEIEAAILIQSYYRRYKTYAYYKKMSHAAVLIQNQFRTYYAKRKKRGDTGATTRRESERLKKGRNQSVIIQQRFRSHYQRRSLDGKEGSGQAQGSGDAPDSSPPPPETSSQYPEGTPPTDADPEATAATTSGQSTCEDGGGDTETATTSTTVTTGSKKSSISQSGGDKSPAADGVGTSGVVDFDDLVLESNASEGCEDDLGEDNTVVGCVEETQVFMVASMD